MDWTLTKDKSWPALVQQFDWVAAMQEVPQDPRYHAEGDVATHTQMVLAALQSEPAYQDLPRQKQEILWAAALLHDVEKRSTTVVEEDGSITSRNHAKKGEFTARQVLFRDIPTPFFLREEIVALVRLHGLPLWLLQKPNPPKALLEASLRTEINLLYLLTRADVLGRICADQQELLERVEFFKALAEEANCWCHPKVFPSPDAQFNYFYKEDASPDYIPFRKESFEVIILSGLPGMGKDKYIKQHYEHLPEISLDAIREQHNLKPDDTSATGWAVQQAREQAREYLRKKQSFVWNATNITRQMRSQLIDLFVTYGAWVKLVYVEVPYATWKKQNIDRENPVPEKVLYRLLQKLEVPQLTEAHEVVYVVE
ncbi:MAG: AAA family ATPase [Adhaeribacter sp.]